MDWVAALHHLLAFLHAQNGQNGAADNTPKNTVEIRVHAVDGVTDRNEFPEPWKTTTLLAEHTNYSTHV